MRNAKVIQNPEKPVAAEIIAQSIVDIGVAMNQIKNSRLNEKALIVLIANHTKLGMGTVYTVLSCLGQLEDIYLKKKEKS